MKYVQNQVSLFLYNYSFMSISLLFSSYAHRTLAFFLIYVSFPLVTESNKLYCQKCFLHFLSPQIASWLRPFLLAWFSCFQSLTSLVHFAFYCWTSYSAAGVIENWIFCECCGLVFKDLLILPHLNCLVFLSTSVLPWKPLMAVTGHTHTCLYMTPGFQDFPLF